MNAAPAQRRNCTALSWVREDLDKLLDQASRQIESLAQNPTAGAEAMGGARDNLERLKLTFETLQLDGARQVLEEMLTLFDALPGKAVENRDQAMSAMLDAMVVLPAHLDRLVAGHHDLPVLLLPLINNLREARSAQALSEGTLFTPLLDVELPELEIVVPPGYEEPYEYFTGRMSRQYENALQNWLQDQEDLSLLSPLHGICETMRHRMHRYDFKRLWWVATEVVGGLMEGFAENDVYLRRLLARLELLMKSVARDGEDAIEPETTTSITQALLFHVAKARQGCSGLDTVRERFRLDELVPDRESLMRGRSALAGRNREMYLSLGIAVQDELSLVKDALDLELRTGQVDEERRRQCVEALNRLQDTLRMLGLSGTAESIGDLLPDFMSSAGSDRDERAEALATLAEQLVRVEASLKEQIDTLGEPLAAPAEDSLIDLPLYEQIKIRQRLMGEAVVSLHDLQDTIRRRFSGDELAEPTPLLEEVAGALELINDEDTAAQCRRLRTLLDARLKRVYSEAGVPPEELEALTDSIAALELYLAAQRDQQEDGERFRAILADRLDHLEAAAAVVEAVPEPEAAVEPRAPRTMPQAREEKERAEAPDEAASAETIEDELPESIDPELRGIFLEEYETVLETLQHAIPAWMSQLEDVDALTDIRRAFHTLKGSGRMVGAEELGDFSWQIEDMLNALLEGRVRNFADISVMVRLAQASLPALRQRLLQETSGLSGRVIRLIGERAQALGRDEPIDWQELRKRLPAYLAGMLPGGAAADAADAEPRDEEDELRNLLRQELTENLEVTQRLLEAISKDRGTRATEEQVRAMHTIAGALAMQPEGQDAGIARAIEDLLKAQAKTGRRFDNEDVWTLLSAVGQIQARLERLKGEAESSLPEDQEEVLEQLLAVVEKFRRSDARAGQEIPVPSGQDEAVGFDPGQSVFARGEDQTDIAQSRETAPQWPAEQELPAPPAREPAGADPEIVTAFLEEAREVLERSDTLLDSWRDDLTDLGWVRSLQREIHTFKGGARMAGFSALGEFSHATESLLERIAEKKLPPTVSSVQVLEDACDRLQRWVEQVARDDVPDAEGALALFRQQVQALEGVPAEPSEPAEAPREEREIPELPDMGGEAGEPSGPRHIRVEAGLLDSLVNAAGEVSIYRSRLEQQVGTLRHNLREFDDTTARLREQFRKLEIEIETSIRSSYRDLEPAGEDGFDPLELDEFSTLQQLSRSLSESVSDLLNLQEMLDDNARRSEQLLIQQSRVSTELQEGLMKTRMVPFGSISARLRRLVRSAAKESGKQARLQMRVIGTSDELDRNVLEHITAPLEHMLRNAVVHGIESPEARTEAGKEPEGEIGVTVESEATEFVIRITDDGAGIDLAAIREAAVERGLLAAEAEPSREQLYEFMLDSGFSTSSQVTRLAGRGVGMDVVSSEIKQIGGSLEIDSERSKGTRFTIRIPFTLAVMQAIGVMAGDQRYLLPLSSVVGVARILPADYTALIADEMPTYRFAGDQYPVLDIETLLGETPKSLGRENVSLLILSAGEQKAALRVPELLPHREVVIKPVGPQIGSVAGILGGAISPRGEVDVILDPGPLIRHALIHGVGPAAVPVIETREDHKPLVMVVDDSITMRKVTSRVLQNHDYEVFTAKDGVDALEQLMERIPDLMLLDIEMPRMDGYELTEHVRKDTRLRDIPIMMITSRAGQKHRDRARQAGADAYLTKPYAELELIEEVQRLLNQAEKDD